MQFAWLQEKTAVSYKGNEWDVTGSQRRHKEAADFCAWYFWAGISSHISLMNKVVGCAEKQETVRRKQKAICRLCKDWKAKTQTPATTFTSAKHRFKSVTETALSLIPGRWPAQETQNGALGRGGMKKAEVDWPTVT